MLFKEETNDRCYKSQKTSGIHSSNHTQRLRYDGYMNDSKSRSSSPPLKCPRSHSRQCYKGSSTEHSSTDLVPNNLGNNSERNS